MKARYFLAIPIFIFLAVGCKSNKNTTKANDGAVLKTETAGNDSTMRFIVSFYSIGSGTERNQIEKLKNFIYEYGTSKSKDIHYNTVTYGKEGEIDYCLSLKELNADEQKDFITNAKNTLKEGKWIQYFENKPCRKQN